MKKYLMILSSIIAIGGGTIASVINTEKNQGELNEKSSLPDSISTDFASYNITDGSTAKISLTNSLTLFQELHEFHKENSVDIKLTGVPGLDLSDEYGNIFVGAPFQNIIIIYDLINSDAIEFKENILEISANGIKLLLTYKIGDVEETVQLETATVAIPSKIDNMRIRVSIPWTY